MLAKDSDGLASLLLDTRRLICILGAGQNADGVSRGAVLSFAGFRSGMQSLVAISLRTPDQRYLEKGRVGSALSKRSGFLAALAQIICFSTAGGNADRYSIGKKCWPRSVMGWRPSYSIPDGSSAFWELAKMQIDFPGKLCCHLLVSGRACSLWCPYSLRTPDPRYLEKARVRSALSARWLPCCSGANYLRFDG